VDERGTRVRSRPGVTRLALLTWVFEALQPDFDPPAEPTFDDVPPTHRSYVVIEWTVAVGLLSGWGDGTFRPGRGIPTATAAAVLTKARLLADAR
jgi:hypothetical protein